MKFSIRCIGREHEGLINRSYVRPDMRYCSRSRCFHPDPGTKHISVPPRHMTKSYAPDFQHDITTLQIQGYTISYNRHTTASNTIQQGKIHVWVHTTSKFLVAKRKTSIPITTRVQLSSRRRVFT